jgi:hypothetical protein
MGSVVIDEDDKEEIISYHLWRTTLIKLGSQTCASLSLKHNHMILSKQPWRHPRWLPNVAALELERKLLNRNLPTNAVWTVSYDCASETEMRMFGYLI